MRFRVLLLHGNGGLHAVSEGEPSMRGAGETEIVSGPPWHRRAANIPANGTGIAGSDRIGAQLGRYIAVSSPSSSPW